MTQTIEAPERFSPGFSREAVEALSRARHEPAWMLERRLSAWRAYEQASLPTTSERAWKYTDISRLDLGGFLPSSDAQRDTTAPFGLETPQAGMYAGLLRQRDSFAEQPELDEEARRAGVIFTSLDDALQSHPDLVRTHFMTECVPAESDKFAALHGALWSGGVFLYVPKNVTVRLPLYSLLWGATAGLALFPHVLLIAEPGSEVTLVEEYASDEAATGILSSGATEIFVRDNATVRYVNLQRFGGTVQHFGRQRALLDRDATLRFATVGLGGRLTKATVESIMRGAGGDSEQLGIFYGRRNQQFDYVTLQDHRAANTTSDLLFKSALNDRARSIYYGLVRIGPEARQAAANQENRNLVLSARAKADSDPVLEILTSEVTRCTHGASVGPVDEEQLFYLESRGISRSEAEKLLVQGYFNQVIGRIPVPEVRGRLEQAVDQRVEM